MRFVHTADTHLGFEITATPKSDPRGRKNRADSILRNFLAVVQHAIDIKADLFIHSGDLFNKHYLPRDLLDELIGPIRTLHGLGIPALILPGNHERSEFPFDLFHGLKNVFVFERPKCLSLRLDDYSVGVAGFPFIRNDSRRTFLRALEETEYRDLRCDLKFLMTHQAFDQAIAGPFMFRLGRSDTVAREALPLDLDYVAAGHVHLHQVLDHPLKPGMKIVYPGSVQRMSFAEREEEKGFVEGELADGKIHTRFIRLPAHDMEIVEIEAAGLTAGECEKEILAQTWRFREDLVIRFKLAGGARAKDYPAVDFDALRSRMPPVLECQFAIKVGNRWVLR